MKWNMNVYEFLRRLALVFTLMTVSGLIMGKEQFFWPFVASASVYVLTPDSEKE